MKYRDWLYEWLENFVKPNVKENTYCKYIPTAVFIRCGTRLQRVRSRSAWM